MTDLGATIAPKSDQMNADDLIQGPRTITITAVKAGDKEQPIAIYFQGDDGKPYKPCKGMRRVLVAFWGPDGSAYVGRSMTLFRNPKVKWGGIEVGGIQISHMTHITGDQTFSLTESKTSRKPFTVKALQKPPTAKPDAKPPGNIEQALRMIAGTDKTTIEHVLAKLREFAWTKKEGETIKEAADKVNARFSIEVEDV